MLFELLFPFGASFRGVFGDSRWEYLNNLNQSLPQLSGIFGAGVVGWVGFGGLGGFRYS